MNLFFVATSAALGVGLAMDAFSVSLANGLHEPYMKRNRIFAIAGVYAFFQYIMPMIGWICQDFCHCGRVCLLPIYNAHDRMDLRPYDR